MVDKRDPLDLFIQIGASKQRSIPQCRLGVHTWDDTASQLMRVCHYCGAVQFFQNGEWIFKQLVKRARKHSSDQEQAKLF